MISPKTDINAHVKAVMANTQLTAAGAAIALVAGATEDGVKITGKEIDLLDYDNPQSLALVIAGLASLVDTKTLSFAVEYQTGAATGVYDTAVEMQASTVAATGDTGDTDEPFEVQLGLKISGLKRFLRFNVTPAMSATTADIACWAATAVLGGPAILPAT